MDYTIFYRDAYEPRAGWQAGLSWDLFVSAYNTTERVQRVFGDVQAAQKHWVVHSEYGFAPSELPPGPSVYAPTRGVREDEFISEFISRHCPGITGQSICVDISGFMRPHLLFFLRILATSGVKSLDVLYSEPREYVRADRTEFSIGSVTDVRPVAGFEGLHQPSTGGDDLLILGAGYEHQLMRHVAAAKNNTRKLQLLGFPPLQADFYQQNVLNAQRAAEAVGAMNERHPLFAPANDPFVTAMVLQETIAEQRRKGVKNIYLCPLSSRPQALGFALYHIFECAAEPVSIIYPFATRYARESAGGISRIWKYAIELP